MRRAAGAPDPSYRRPAGRRLVRPGWRAAFFLLLCGGALAPRAAAQTVEELKAQLEAERAARIALEKRLAELEAWRTGQETADTEAELRKLIAPEDLQRAPKTTIFPGAANPAIGVFADAVLQGGNFDSKLGEDSDRFSMRETEIDMRLPISPFAEGVLIVPIEDEGNGDFNATLEEGYANVGLGKLFDQPDWETTVKIGRSRPIFGRNNQLHTHDWLQVNQPLPVQNLLGEEGIVGDGFNFHMPLGHYQGEDGLGGATSLDFALVNGEMVTGEESPLGELASDAGLNTGSDDGMLTARVSQFVETGLLSDLEVGLSTIQPLGANAVTVGPDSGTETRIHPHWYDADITFRSRDDETGIGSWLLQAETILTDVDYDTSGAADFPEGTQHRNGWWLTAQRQMSPTTYLGLLYARSDQLGSPDKDTSISPYLSWYADEFFRIRWQVDFQNRDVADGPDVNGAYRGLMQFTWNFGVHQPHPYWVNK
jgi:hypothetical protein